MMWVYSFRAKLTAKLTKTESQPGKAVPVEKWRIVFDEVPGSTVKTEAATANKSTQDHRFVLDSPGGDHLIEAGKSLNVDLLMYVPKEKPIPKPPRLGNLATRRLA